LSEDLLEQFDEVSANEAALLADAREAAQAAADS